MANFNSRTGQPQRCGLTAGEATQGGGPLLATESSPAYGRQKKYAVSLAKRLRERAFLAIYID